jgi:hypothetical protein
VAKPNYAFAKRQRELAKKQKKEEKRSKQQAAQQDRPPEDQAQAPATPEASKSDTNT